MTDDSQTLIITVNFRNAECTLRFLKSASNLGGFGRCHVLVVDNNSDDGSISRIEQVISELSNVELLPSSQNRGYFGGARWALDQYFARHRAPDWVVVCNNDIVFDDPDFLSRLLRKDPGAAGVIAPSIISGLTGHDANPWLRQRPREFQMWRYRLWLSNYYAMWLKQWLSPFIRSARYRFSKRTHSAEESGSSRIYAPHGAFFIFSRKFFEAGGFIDDGFFLYAEEFSVAEMCRQLGLPVIHDPSLRVWHAGSQSTGRMLTRKVYQYQKDGFVYVLSRYKSSYPELGVAALAVRSTVPEVAPSSIPAAGDTVR